MTNVPPGTGCGFRRGRTIRVSDVETRDDAGKPCATSRVTIAARPPQA